VKLLDFGLAKSETPVGSPPTSLSVAATARHDLTAPGTIIGTLHYMAPEQLEGRATDARTDIYAFGVVLYEMLTGRKPFDGDSQAAIVAAILDRDPPPITIAQPNASRRLVRVVETCLAKDPDSRWQSARDLVRELTWLAEPDERPAGATKRGRHRAWLPWTVGGAATAAAFAAGMFITQPRAVRRTPMQFQIGTPPTSEPISFELSPDAKYIAFVANADGVSKLLLRPLDQLATKALAGTDGAIFPFWSPDGRSIGFFAGGKLKVIDLDGGSPRVLADAPNGRGGSWNRDGTILFAPSTAGGILRVASTGGAPTAVTRLATGQSSHRWPEFLPDGRRFLFHANQGAKGANGLFLASLDGGDVRRVLDDDVPTTFVAPGTLLMARKDAVVAAPFDTARGIVGSDVVRITDAVGWDATWSKAAMSASAAGVLAYRTGLTVPRRLVWFDRAGSEAGSVGPTDDDAPSCPEISPDGRHALLFRTVESNVDVWQIDLLRGVSTRVTFEDAVDFFAIWSPDRAHIMFGSNRNGPYEFFDKDLTGTGADRLLPVPSTSARLPMSASPDGRFLLYAEQTSRSGVDLWALALSGDRKAFPVVQTPFDEMAGQFSPDGRWVAYESNESGHAEIYARSFPSVGSAIQISSAGGTQARWRADGKELYYIAPDGRLMAAAIAPAAGNRTLDVGAPTPLFVTHLATGMNIFPAVGTRPQYAVAPDGRFLMNVGVEGGSIPPITISAGWNAGR